MITLKVSEEAVLKMAQTCVSVIREDAHFVGLFTRVDGGSARAASVRLAHRHVVEYRPVIQAAVAKFGADLFRRKSPIVNPKS